MLSSSLVKGIILFRRGKRFNLIIRDILFCWVIVFWMLRGRVKRTLFPYVEEREDPSTPLTGTERNVL